MGTGDLDIKFTMLIPYDRPNRNGVIYTKKAVVNAVNYLPKNIPIIAIDGDGIEKTIGVTTGDCHIVTWNAEKQECRITIDGKLIGGGTSCVANEMQDGVVTSFEIESIGIIT